MNVHLSKPAQWLLVGGCLLSVAGIVGKSYLLLKARHGQVPQVEKTLGDYSSETVALTYSPDGTLLATACFDYRSKQQQCKLWEVSSWTLRHTFAVTTEVIGGLAFSPDAKLLAVGTLENSVFLLDTKTGRVVRRLQGKGDVQSVAFSPDGKMLLGGSLDEVFLWKVTTGKPLYRWPANEPVDAVAYSPDGKILASGDLMGTVTLRDAATQKILATFAAHPEGETCLAFSSDSRQLATASWDSTAKLWEVQPGKLLHTLEGHWAAVKWIGFSHDGKRVATAGDDTVRLWDTATGVCLHNFKSSVGLLSSAAFSSDDTHLAVGGMENHVDIWKLPTH